MYVITKDTKLNIKEIVREALGYYNEFPTRFEKDYTVLVNYLDETGEGKYYADFHFMDSDFVTLLFDNYDGLAITPYIRKLFGCYVESEFDGMFAMITMTLEDFAKEEN